MLFGTGITALSLSLTLRLMAWAAAKGEKGGGLALAIAYGGGLILAAGLSLVLGVGAHLGEGQAVSWSEVWNTLFGLSSKRASEIIADVGKAVAEWRIVAQTLGQSKVQIDRMASAFEHNDLEEARP